MKKLSLIVLLLGGIALIPANLFGTDRYALISGGSGTSCTIGSPCALTTILIGGATALTAGDTGFLCVTDCDGADSGTYTGWFDDNIPPGTSFATAVTLKPYPGETITLQPAAASDRAFNFFGDDTKYIVIDGFVIDCVNVAYDCIKIESTGGTYAHHIRIQNNEIKNWTDQGILIVGDATNGTGNEILNNNIHDGGTLDNLDHCIYIESSNNLVEGNSLHSCKAFGLQLFHSGSTTAVNNNIARKNLIYSNGNGGGGGAVISSGSGNLFYNNIVRSNAGTAGILVYGGASATGVYNNTVYGNTAEGIETADTTSGALIKNNILNSNGSDFTDAGSGTSFASNWCNSSGTGCASSGDPLFTNPGSADFTLQSGSPAIDFATDLSSVFSTDILGVVRPQPSGGAWDDGAYERPSGGGGPPSSIIVFDSANVAEAVGSSVTFSHTVANQANRVSLLFVAIGTATMTTVSAADFNGDSFGASICSATYSAGGTDAKALIYKLTSPDVGTHTVTVTFSDAPGAGGAGVMTFYNVDQSTTNRTSSNSNGSSTSASVTPTSVLGDMVTDVVHRWNTNTLTAGANQTVRIPSTQLGPDPDYIAGSSKIAVGSSTTMSWTFSGPADRWAHCGVALIPATATPVKGLPVLRRGRGRR